MIKISNIIIPAKYGLEVLSAFAAAKIGVAEDGLRLVKITKLSVDSRKKPNINRVVTAVFECKKEKSILKRHLRDVSVYTEEIYTFPYRELKSNIRPVIVGFGPAGIFAALTLTEAGLRPIVVERGADADKRTEDVYKFWETGELNENSNVQYGEGGAGLFSDGKLTTGIGDKRIAYVLRRFVEFGAPEDIEYLAKPHIGTDKLKILIKNMREYLIANGCDIRFDTKLIGIESEDGAVKSAKLSDKSGEYEIRTDAVILALGNAARDTFLMLHKSGFTMEPKSFAVGVRIEHLQKDIDLAQYGEAATLGTLPASDYKLAVHRDDGRGVFTFCVCPGGYVVAAASEKGGVVTNGMSEYARDNENINGGLLVSVDPKDFENTLFGGMEFQEKLEKAAFNRGGGNFFAPAQTVSDFLAKRPTTQFGKVTPSYTPGVTPCNLWDVLPDFICESIRDGILGMEKKIHGFASPDAVLTAVETRSSSPVRICRDENGESSIKGVFPCGEGAGFAGGITSASVDGIKTAEKLCLYLDKLLNCQQSD